MDPITTKNMYARTALQLDTEVGVHPFLSLLDLEEDEAQDNEENDIASEIPHQHSVQGAVSLGSLAGMLVGSIIANVVGVCARGTVRSLPVAILAGVISAIVTGLGLGQYVYRSELVARYGAMAKLEIIRYRALRLDDKVNRIAVKLLAKNLTVREKQQLWKAKFFFEEVLAHYRSERVSKEKENSAEKEKKDAPKALPPTPTKSEASQTTADVESKDEGKKTEVRVPQAPAPQSASLKPNQSLVKISSHPDPYAKAEKRLKMCRELLDAAATSEDQAMNLGMYRVYDRALRKLQAKDFNIARELMALFILRLDYRFLTEQKKALAELEEERKTPEEEEKLQELRKELEDIEHWLHGGQSVSFTTYLEHFDNIKNRRVHVQHEEEEVFVQSPAVMSRSEKGRAHGESPCSNQGAIVRYRQPIQAVSINGGSDVSVQKETDGGVFLKIPVFIEQLQKMLGAMVPPVPQQGAIVRYRQPIQAASITEPACVPVDGAADEVMPMKVAVSIEQVGKGRAAPSRQNKIEMPVARAVSSDVEKEEMAPLVSSGFVQPSVKGCAAAAPFEHEEVRGKVPHEHVMKNVQSLPEPDTDDDLLDDQGPDLPDEETSHFSAGQESGVLQKSIKQLQDEVVFRMNEEEEAQSLVPTVVEIQEKSSRMKTRAPLVEPHHEMEQREADARSRAVIVDRIAELNLSCPTFARRLRSLLEKEGAHSVVVQNLLSLANPDGTFEDFVLFLTSSFIDKNGKARSLVNRLAGVGGAGRLAATLKNKLAQGYDIFYDKNRRIEGDVEKTTIANYHSLLLMLCKQPVGVMHSDVMFGSNFAYIMKGLSKDDQEMLTEIIHLRWPDGVAPIHIELLKRLLS